ncbi:reverse transcriptase domain, reverse transcriptase zinc-binding domain protein, partial [Tanacetum coccineum]
MMVSCYWSLMLLFRYVPVSAVMSFDGIHLGTYIVRLIWWHEDDGSSMADISHKIGVSFLCRALGVFQCFSIAGAWDYLWLRADVVNWYHVIWFPHCIPRHAIHMWLVIKEKLKTQDRLRQWDVGPSIDLNLLKCPLCDMIVLAAMTYFLWNERNSRLFKKKKSTADQIVQHITSLVRMKLVTFKFKRITVGSRLLLDQWKIPSSCFDHDGSS